MFVSSSSDTTVYIVVLFSGVQKINLVTYIYKNLRLKNHLLFIFFVLRTYSSLLIPVSITFKVFSPSPKSEQASNLFLYVRNSL